MARGHSASETLLAEHTPSEAEHPLNIYGMNALLGWGLAAVAVAGGFMFYGFQGLALGVTVTVFWLLLQFSRAVRVMKMAGNSPVGHAESAVMLHAKLQRGMTLMQVVTLTKSIGRRLPDHPDAWSWADDSGAQVNVMFVRDKCSEWTLTRTGEGEAS